MEKKNLRVRVVEINGFCPCYRLGDEFTIRAGYMLEGRSVYCLHALSALLPFYVALASGVDPVSLGLARPGEKAAYIQCPDPQKSIGGGTVIFEVTVVE
ncbi:MAG: TIGR04076 family protein [Calditrichaeota bacterium]|nr:TIGR04076 family protein [Calditrichota bacterium]